MKVSVPLPGGLSLDIGEEPAGGPEPAGTEPAGTEDQQGRRLPKAYPTRRLPKGLLLHDGGEPLAEEGVGFGVPILKRGVQTIFPGSVEVASRQDGPVWEVTAAYDMRLVERLAKPGGGGDAAGGSAAGGAAGGSAAGGELVRSRLLYAAKDSLAALHRRFPRLRGPLTATSLALRRRFGWVTTYEEAGFRATVPVTYAIREGNGAAGDEPARLTVAVDLAGLAGRGVTEVVLMNEQGARPFDCYEDSDGAVLRGREIGTWDKVTAERAAFVSRAHRVSFSLGQAEGATLHRGTELVGSRLAWAGFGYSLRPERKTFSYELRIETVS